MPRLSMLPTLIREVFGPRTLRREPEPDMVMESDDQVAAFAEAGRIDGVMAAAYLFNSARISQVIQSCRRVADLGCGPATQLAQLAELNPGISFLGIDLSQRMLEDARSHVDGLGLGNVEFACADITHLDSVPDGSVDGVISTMVLHHLPTEDDLRACFRAIRRILRPDGAIYLIDFGRLKAASSTQFFAYLNQDRQPELFSRDYEYSLKAAFGHDDFLRIGREELPETAHVHTTFLMPVLTLTKSADRTLVPAIRERIREMRRRLPRRYRRELDDIRLFFWLGGMRNDPFR